MTAILAVGAAGLLGSGAFAVLWLLAKNKVLARDKALAESRAREAKAEENLAAATAQFEAAERAHVEERARDVVLRNIANKELDDLRRRLASAESPKEQADAVGDLFSGEATNPGAKGTKN